MLGRLFGISKPPEPSGKELASKAVEANSTLLSKMEEQYDNNQRMIEQLGREVQRLSANPATKNGAMEAFKRMQKLQKEQTELGGKIATLSHVSGNMKGASDNILMYNAIKQSNVASGKIQESLNVDDVHSEMDRAREIADNHSDVSNALSGQDFLDPVDTDEMESEMLAFIGQQNQQQRQGYNPTAGIQVQQPYVPAMTPNQRSAYAARQVEEEAAIEAMLSQSRPVPTGQQQQQHSYNNANQKIPVKK